MTFFLLMVNPAGGRKTRNFKLLEVRRPVRADLAVARALPACRGDALMDRPNAP
jgi:hypothetical protein